jgi:catechol 2,3-dioxygenase-like lactoylglutathione lyase family enzyme
VDSILGVDHVGVGVRDLQRIRAFYAEVFGFGVIAEMPEEDHPAIQGLLRSHTAVHASNLLGTPAGGMTLALFQAVDPPPRPIRRDGRYGDIGVAKLTFAVADVDAFCRENEGRLDLAIAPRGARLDGWGDYRFAYARDPEGNLFEIVTAPDAADWESAAGEGPGPSAAPTLLSAAVAVTDLDRSLGYYMSVLGLDMMVVPPHCHFSGMLDEVAGHPMTTLRSCLLGSSRGTGMLEILETTRPRGRSIPFGTQWGDFGYLQLCVYATGEHDLAAEIEALGLDVLLPAQTIEDPDFPAKFMYLRDPDGIPVEVLILPAAR